MSSKAIILFAHGARDPQWASPFEQLAALVKQQKPECIVSLAFLELMQPNLAECVASLLAEGVDNIVIVPAFMARGSHLRRDLPLLVDELRQKHDGIQLSVTDALGEAPPILQAMANWIGLQ